MEIQNNIYQGNQNLEKLLEAAGVMLSVAEVRRFIESIATAASKEGKSEWVHLLSPLLRIDKNIALLYEVTALLEQEIKKVGKNHKSDTAYNKILKLRKLLDQKNLGGFVVPLADEYQGEFVSRRSQRLEWLTGFTGSAGLAIILEKEAAIFTDGRYMLQVADQVDKNLYDIHHVHHSPPQLWLKSRLSVGMKIGYDPWLHTYDQCNVFRNICKVMGAQFFASEINLIDEIWLDQPPPPVSPIVPHAMCFSGQNSIEKRLQIGKNLKRNGSEVAFLGSPDSIAWLLNIRGADIDYTPICHSLVIIDCSGSVRLFVDERKVTPGIRLHFGEQVTCLPLDSLGRELDVLAMSQTEVQIDLATSPDWVCQRLMVGGAQIINKQDPCLIYKSCKNKIEIDGMRAAHVRDGVALSRFLHWASYLDGTENIKESIAAQTLASFRENGRHYQGPSFETISGSAANGAIVHYRVTPYTDITLKPETLFLVDSGGQYFDGTTDVTRTIAIGKPKNEYCDRFTRVLKGHIALATASFPSGTSGAQLDSLARQYLWQIGADYDHGTGHGVGSYLNVHEGPQRVSKYPSNVALESGMVISNEPGFYKTGEYGIRIENLMCVISLSNLSKSKLDMLGFETLTMAPISKALIKLDLLTNDEIGWIDRYHAKVRERISPGLKKWPEACEWLGKATTPLKY